MGPGKRKGQGMAVMVALIGGWLGLLAGARCQAEIDPGLLAAAWLFDEGHGNLTEDVTGNGFDGELKKGPLWVDGRFGMALDFKGGSYVEVLNSAQNLAFGGVEPFTITAWVFPRGGGTVIGKFNGGVIGAYILVVRGNIIFHREVAPWGLSSNASVPNNEFSHVAATYDGAEMRIYIDGKLDAKQARGAQNTDLVTPVLIGARFTGGQPSEHFDGILDEVALFNVALTEDQIREVMKGLAVSKAVEPAAKLAVTWGRLKR